MNVNIPLTLFPLIPFTAVFASLMGKYLLDKDVSKIAIICGAVLQLITGIYLILSFYQYTGMYSFAVSEWKHSIKLSFDEYRVFFMMAYLTPVLMTLFYHKTLVDFNIRILFMFFLGGCSGILVAGDIFNFYIFYEVMIMSAYVLIAVNRKYYASIKYMIMGAASSAVFLAGIILLYASGSYFDYSFINNMNELNPSNVRFIFIFFTTAFLIKAAFFPVSGWVATCHTATNSLVSSFLASFTIFSGIIGLFYFVILPAGQIGDQSILTFIGIISSLTILIPSVIIFFEPDLKRCIAGSTIFTIGYIGLFLAGGEYKLALLYVAIHSIYKSFMFLMYDDVTVKKMKLTSNTSVLLILIVSILFTVGMFPALTYFLKYNYIGRYEPFKFISYISLFLVLGSFLKFRFKTAESSIRLSTWSNYLPYLIFPVVLIGYYLFFPFSWSHSGIYLLIDLLILITALFVSRFVYNRLGFLNCLDTRFIYTNINYELLYVVILFISQIFWLQAF